jgi:hypothetical protein
LAIRFAGDSLRAALNAGEQQREKMSDTGPTLTAEGVANRGAAKAFDQTGANMGGFAQDANDPAARKYFEQFANGLMNFNTSFG